MAALEVLALNTTTPQIMAPQSGDTYTFPRAVEMPLGTANGVLYLNGSKVVTSGSGLTFDGTNLGLGTNAPKNNTGYATLTLNNATNGGVVQFCQADTTVGQLFFDGSNAVLRSVTNIPLVFGVNNAEQMRLTSTGLGIGTSSPTDKLTVRQDTAGGVSTATFINGTAAAASTTGQSFRLRLGSFGGFISNPQLAPYIEGVLTSVANGWSALAFGYYGVSGVAEGMRLDSSGNLGLGVTPSAWGSSNKAIQLPSGAVWSISNQFTVGANVYDSSGGAFTYVANGFASRYRQLDSQHAWFTAPSGTAGNAISFTQAMTLDASGNLLVNRTSVPTGSVAKIISEGRFSSFRSGVAGYEFGVSATVSDFTISDVSSGSAVIRCTISPQGSFVTGNAALATNATDGFLYVAGCAGTPTGTPTAYTGRVPIVIDTTNNKLYFYSGGAWRDAGP